MTILRYDAFISYRHTDPDRRAAKKLHKFLETYRVPAELVKQGYPSRLTRVFRDKEELPTSSDLGADIVEALRQSAFLIVVCSPRTPASAWVVEEVDTFIRLGRADKILVLLIEGDPQQAFPTGLIVPGNADAGTMACEPLAADVRGPNRPRLRLLPVEGLRLVARMLGCHYDDLRRRHDRRRRRQRFVVAAAAAAVLCAVGGAVFWVDRAQNQRDRITAATDLIDIATHLNNRWNSLSNIAVLEDVDRNMVETLRRAQPAVADELIAANIGALMQTKTTQIQGAVHDDPVMAQVFPAVIASANRLGFSVGDFELVHQLAGDADLATQQFRSDLADVASYLSRDHNISDLYVAFAENDHRRIGLYTDAALAHARQLAKAVCAVNCPTAVMSQIEMIPQRQITSENTKALLQELEERQALVGRLANLTRNVSDQIKSAVEIRPSDDSQHVLGKASMLRAYGRPQDSLAAYAFWREKFAAGQVDLLPLAEAGEQLSRQYDELKIAKAILVLEVDPAGEGARAGLKAGDLIISYDGEAVSFLDPYLARVKATDSARTVVIDLLRRGPDGRFLRSSVQASGGLLGTHVAGL